MYIAMTCARVRMSKVLRLHCCLFADVAVRLPLLLLTKAKSHAVGGPLRSRRTRRAPALLPAVSATLPSRTMPSSVLAVPFALLATGVVAAEDIAGRFSCAEADFQELPSVKPITS